MSETCVNCGVEITGEPFLHQGEVFCCERCYKAGAVRNATLQQYRAELEKVYHLTIEALVAALDAREKETGNHSERVARYTLLMAEKMGLSREECLNIYRGSLLHDIGKIGISDNILLKPGELTEEEWAEMRKHPVVGHQILSGIDYLADESEIVLTHEERYDGSGYPRGLQGGEIPLGSRLFVISDTLDAIAFDRPYRKALPFREAEKEILRYSGTQFDPDLVPVFQACSGDLENLVSLYHETMAKKAEEIHLYDLVCTMEVNVESPHQFIYASRTFYFCSGNCRAIFEKSPEHYIKGS